MVLKEYVVVTDRHTEFMFWTKAQWENYERLKERAPESEKSTFTCRAITTFNADEQLQEQNGLRWVKGNYEKLYKLAKAGNRVACYVDYDFYRDGGIHPKFRDICSIGHNPMYLEFSARGIGYSTYIGPGENELEEFLIECTRLNVEWLDETQPGQPVPAGEWISVEKELPDFNQEVLVFGKRRLTQPTMDGNPPKVMLGYRQDLTDSSIPKRDWLRYADKNNFRMMEDVTHWRPLPAPPSPKQEDNQ